MSTSIGFDPVLPYPQIIVLAILAVGFALWLYRRGSPTDTSRQKAMATLSILRAAGIGAIILLLLNPVFTPTDRSKERPPLLLLVDQSRSMATRDAGSQSRFEAAKAATVQDSSLMQDLQRHYNVRVFGVAETATPIGADAFLKTGKPDGAHTYLGESMAQAVASVPTATTGGILLVSDGRNNGDADPVAAARQASLRHFPVFTLCVGTASRGRDVSLLNRRPQVFAAPQQQVPITAEVRSVGYSGQTAQVDLIQQGKTVQTKSIRLDDHQPMPISFDVTQAKEGVYRYTVSLRPMPAEVTLANNKISVFLQVLKSKARVLVLEARPSWDAKFLIQALQTDPSIDVDSIFKLSDEKTFAVSGGTDDKSAGTDKTSAAPVAIKVPTTAAEFAKYDVVVIGKGYEDFFDAKSTLALQSFVSDHAGNVIFLRGNPGRRTGNLSVLEPLQWSNGDVADVRMKVTDEGRRNPAFDFPTGTDPDLVIQKLPNLISATKVDGEKALTVVLARAAGVPSAAPNQEMAVLAYQNFGQGKVVSLVGEGLWRWALLPPALNRYGGCYNDFWTQLIRWLVNQSDFLPGQNISLKTDKTTYAPGESASLMAFVRGKTMSALPPVTIVMPSGKSTKVTMAKGGGTRADFVGAYVPHEPGEYLARLDRPAGGSLIVPFSVFPSNEEELVTAADPEMMHQIAEAGGGEMLTPSTMDDLLPKLKEAKSVTNLKTEPQSAWDRGPILMLILVIFSSEWILRRRWGLL